MDGLPPMDGSYEAPARAPTLSAPYMYALRQAGTLSNRNAPSALSLKSLSLPVSLLYILFLCFPATSTRIPHPFPEYAVAAPSGERMCV